MIEYAGLVKHQILLDALKRMELSLNLEPVQIEDYWEADLCAVGLRKGDRLVYLAVNLPEKRDEINYDFELLDEQDKTEVNVIKEARGIDEATLIKDVKEFLEL